MDLEDKPVPLTDQEKKKKGRSIQGEGPVCATGQTDTGVLYLRS